MRLARKGAQPTFAEGLSGVPHFGGEEEVRHEAVDVAASPHERHW